VRRRPYCVLLFDEIEKAHQDVFNILLQVLDDGRLTDGQGRTVDFRNTVVIMTSNIASHIIAEMPPAAPPDEVDQVRARVLAELREHFRPEFLNRVDDIIVFSRLSREQLREIVEIQLRQLRTRLAERSITLEIDDKALDLLASEGYDPTYGARPLKRVIQRRLQDPLAMAILDGRLRDGDPARVRAPDGEILIDTPQHSDAVPAGT
jgi:ATP-dependent Clp protease ATP-binding subunit ClpB